MTLAIVVENDNNVIIPDDVFENPAKMKKALLYTKVYILKCRFLKEYWYIAAYNRAKDTSGNKNLIKSY